MESSDDEYDHEEMWKEINDSYDLLEQMTFKIEEKDLKTSFDDLEKNYSKYSKKYLDKLVKSKDPKDKETLNSTVIDILEDDVNFDLKYLISKQAIDIYAKDYHGLTILSLAATLTSVKVVKVLLEHMTDSNVDKYNQENLLSLKFYNVLPLLGDVEDTIRTVQLLENKNIPLTLKDKLAVLKFLVHNVEDCNCGNTNDFFNNMEKLMSYGSPAHVQNILNKIKNDISSGSFKKEMSDFYIEVSRPLSPGVLLDLYVDEDVKLLVEDLDQVEGTDVFGVIEDAYPFKYHHGYEWKMMESTKIKNLNLREILKKHPDETYEYIKDLDFHKICSNYQCAGDYMKGLKAKSLIRHQVEEFVPDFVRELLPLLPDLCFDNIMFFIMKLSNEDLLNMCTAAVFQEDKIVN